MSITKKNTLAYKLMKEADIADIISNNPAFFEINNFNKEEVIEFLHKYFTKRIPTKEIPKKINDISREITELCSAKQCDRVDDVKELLQKYLSMLIQFQKSFPGIKLFLYHEPILFVNTILENKRFSSRIDDETLNFFQSCLKQLQQKNH